MPPVVPAFHSAARIDGSLVSMLYQSKNLLVWCEDSCPVAD
jgi:hypothetical protein